VLLNSNYKRYSVRLNSDYKFNDRVSVGVNIAPSYTTSSAPNADANIFGGGIIQSAIATSPIAPYINADGSLPLTATSTGLFPNPNWYRVVQEVKNTARTARILSNAYLNVELIKDLVFRTSINIDATNQRSNNFTPSTAGSLFSAPPIQTRASEAKASNYSWLTENTLNYKRSFGDHVVDALAGYTAQRYYGENSNVNATGFPNDRVQTLNAGSVFTTGFGVSEWSLASFVSRINYNYKSRYMLTASFRRDGSSRFAPNKKYGNFPSISAGWVLSDEAFMSPLRALSFFKLRAGYGLNGNFNIGDYSYLARTGTNNYAFNNTLAQGTTVSSIGNNNLSWEKSKQLDIGADIGLFKDRIFITYDFFHKTTSGMLFNVGIPQQSGFSSITDNVGEFDFKGHEFSIDSRNTVGAFKWTTNFNISFIRNKVVNLGPYATNLPRGDANGPNITMIGKPIGSFYGYQFLGVYMNQQDLDASPQYLGSDSKSTIGTVKYADVNGDKVITADDKTIIGDPNPDFTYGLTNDFSYKNLDLSVVMYGQQGFDIQNRTLEYIQNLDGVFNVTRDVARRWKSPTDPGDGIHPRAVVATPLARTTNSRWVTDGSFLTIKNITLGYTIPINNSLYIKGLRLYAGIQQALVFTNYKGANPEVNDSGTSALVQGIDYTSYPVPRTYSLGINLNLK
jgi:TonB-linked SusC/RagA family outer membrane protein